MYHSEHSALEPVNPPILSVDEDEEPVKSRGMKLRDSLDRRLRFSGRQPTKKRLALSARDYRVFEILNRHGPLSTSYLYQLTRELCSDEEGFTKRLRDLYHGCIFMGDHIYFLDRPIWQQDSRFADRQDLIHDLTDHSRAALRLKGTLVINRESEHPLHRYMRACVMASLKIFIESRMREYHDLYKVLCHPKCPPTTQQAENPLAIPREPDKDEKLYDNKGNKIQHYLIPDDFFAIQGDTARTEFYPVEIDRGTETTQNTARTSLGRKFKHYDAAIDNGSFQKHFGIPRSPIILIFTNGRNRRDNVARYYKKHGKHQDRYLFADTQPYGFDYGWEPPPLLYTQFINSEEKPVSLV